MELIYTKKISVHHANHGGGEHIGQTLRFVTLPYANILCNLYLIHHPEEL